MDLDVTADNWLSKYFSGEVFSGSFSHLSEVIEKINFSLPIGTKVITVAGSNGKGQTIRILEEMLLQSGSSGPLDITSPFKCSRTLLI